VITTAIVEGARQPRPLPSASYPAIQVTFDVDADATSDEVAALIEGSRRRCAVYDMLTGTTPVAVGMV